MLKKKEVFGAAILLSCLLVQGPGFAAILFEDDFEAESLGAEPSRWEYDPLGEIKNRAQIIEDPVEGDKCMSNFGAYVVGEETWTDYIVEWDWLRMSLGRNESVNFRYQDAGHFYHLSPRGGPTTGGATARARPAQPHHCPPNQAPRAAFCGYRKYLP